MNIKLLIPEDNELIGQSDIAALDTLTIILYAILTTSFAEFGSWYMIYRKDEYKSLKNNIELSNNKMKKIKQEPGNQQSQKSGDKKKARMEGQLTGFNRDMSSFRMKANFPIMIFMIIMATSLGNVYQGIIVGKLPFEPFSLLQSITHRGIYQQFGSFYVGLMGDDATDCSYIFIYILSSLVWRTNLQKLCGFDAPKSLMTPWGTPAKM